MIYSLRRALLFSFLALLLSACAGPDLMVSLAAVAAQGSPTPTAAIYQPPADATATPTPFQPIPPTPLWQPTQTPLPTATALPTFTPTATATAIPTEAPTFTPLPEQPQPEEVQPTQEQPKKRRNKKNGNGGADGWNQPEGQVNILLLGSDKRPGDPMFRTDTIILATLNSELGTVNLTSFPRDLYITIPGYGTQRINTAFKAGGFDLLAETFQYNFGVRPTHYVLINFSSFKRVVDSLGGLEVHVGQEVSDYRDGKWITIPKGKVEMDADLVLWYSRSRKTSNDFARARRQQEVLQALFNKALSMDAVKRLPELYDTYNDNVKTNLGFTDILGFLPLAVKMTDSSHLNQYYIGPQQTYDWITYDGAMVLLPRPDEINQVLREALNMR